MKNKLEDSKVTSLETGFSLCRRKDDKILQFGNECEGDNCRIKRPHQRCKNDDIYEGFYHTHPDETSLPSTADLYNLYKDGLGCIGSGLDNNIKCFVRKSIERSSEILDAFEYEHYFMKIHAKEMTDEEYYNKIKNLSDKYFRVIHIDISRGENCDK